MGQSIGEALASPAAYWKWFSDTAARVAALHAVCDLKLLDHLGSGPTSAARVAESSGLDPEFVRRLIEFLAAEGILDTDGKGRFLATNRSRLLQSAGSVTWAFGTMFEASTRLGEAVRKGPATDAWAIANGKPIFAALAENADWGRMFGEAMSFSTTATEAAIFARHEFKPFELAVDVGGSHGDLLMRLLADRPEARGVVFDLPETAEQARSIIAASGMSDRIDVVGGSIFEQVPEGGDLYLLKHVLHDWSDTESLTILKTVRTAMAPGRRLAVIDRLIPDEYRPELAYSCDILMMVCTSGRERRISDFEKLFDEAGFKLDVVTQISDGVSVIEAIAV